MTGTSRMRKPFRDVCSRRNGLSARENISEGTAAAGVQCEAHSTHRSSAAENTSTTPPGTEMLTQMAC